MINWAKRPSTVVNTENIGPFLGKNLHLSYQSEISNNFNTRIQRTRIKHQMGAFSIKIYDKHGMILCIKASSKNVSSSRTIEKYNTELAG